MKGHDTIQAQIQDKLTSALAPVHLEVINESHMHSVPANSETHFKVIIVTDDFEGLTLVKRHRTVNQILAGELAGGVHALGLHTMTPPEWERKHGQVPASPNCLGGSKAGN
ncbi:MAG: BolA/IbaG family iron-sulfur metabolism protein [Gammaproteobacteria bacterium]|nr:BolA/IbaG family iron-sulfur metabolism protein [Gammaproteobacteria bacterium]